MSNVIYHFCENISSEWTNPNWPRSQKMKGLTYGLWTGKFWCCNKDYKLDTNIRIFHSAMKTSVHLAYTSCKVAEFFSKTDSSNGKKCSRFLFSAFFFSFFPTLQIFTSNKMVQIIYIYLYNKLLLYLFCLS